MKTAKKLLMLSVVLAFLAPAGWSQSEDEPGNGGNLDTLVNEARRMAQIWAERLEHWGSETSAPSTYMGVVIESVPDVLRDYIDLPKGVGLLFSHIASESPAEAAGLKDNDIIIAFDGQIVINYSQLSTLIDLTGPNVPIPITVLRKGEELNLTVTLAERRGKEQSSYPAAPPIPAIPAMPAMPGLPEEGVDAILERVEEWIPGSVAVVIDENEQVHVDLSELRNNLQDLRVKLLGLEEAGAMAELKKEYGDLGARTTIVRLQDQNVNFQNADGKLVITSSEAGKQAMVWDTSGDLIYEGEIPGNYAEHLPEAAVTIIRAFEASRRALEAAEMETPLEFHLNEERSDDVSLNTY
jgi:membrane-associated protease RseP (regulator of RpoE activity)